MVKCLHTVATNPWWGLHRVDLQDGKLPPDTTVPKADQVTILWVYNERVADWESKLTKDTFKSGGFDGTLAEAIDAGNQKEPSGPFEHFPHYKTMGDNEVYKLVELTPMQVNLLADLSCWTVAGAENSQEFIDLLNPSSP